MKRVDSLKVAYGGKRVGTLTLDPDNRLCAFEYAPEWLADGFSISPLELPLKSGVFLAKEEPFRGNFGIFEDSMPDGYGRYLLQKALARIGVDSRELDTLQRLSIIGSRGMGALTYSPETEVEQGEESRDFDLLQRKALEVLREQQDTDAGLLLYNSGNSGGARPKAVFADESGHWLVKFRHIYDPKDIGETEYAYNEAARKGGIAVPDFRLLEGKYFATRRFDIDGNGERRHIATAGALLGVSLRQPVLDYDNLLALTGYLTQSEEDVEQMYRRMIFNYLTDNKDDHAKNFSFIVEGDARRGWRWRLAPAYDLTHSPEGYNGQHATSVNGSGNPLLTDFIATGERIMMRRERCLGIIREVESACGPIAKRPISG